MQAAPWGSLPSALRKAPVSSARLEAGLGWGPLPLAAPPRSPPRCPPRPRDAAGLRGLALVVLGPVRRPLRAAGGEEQDALRPRAAGQPRGALPAPGGGGPVRPRQLRLTPAPARWRRDWPPARLRNTSDPGTRAPGLVRVPSQLQNKDRCLPHHSPALVCPRRSGAGGQGTRTFPRSRCHTAGMRRGPPRTGAHTLHTHHTHTRRAHTHTAHTAHTVHTHRTHAAHTPHTYTQGTHTHGTHGTHGAHTQHTHGTHTTHRAHAQLTYDTHI